MFPLNQLPIGTCVEFRAYANWKGYASAMGFHLDAKAALRSGFCRMRRDIGVVVEMECPPHFIYDVVN
jgi:hypothetical protein